MESFKHSERPARVPAPGVDVSYSIGLEKKQVRIKNISPTGVYLITGDRWPQGATVPLTMKIRTASKEDSRSQISIPAKIIRHDCDGVGMEFLHKGLTTGEWLALFSSALTLTSDNNPVRVFRAAKALAFLVRITSFEECQLLELLTKYMIRERTERAIDILLAAEALLDSQGHAPGTNVSSTFIRQILEEGSRNRDGIAQRYWAGILASASLDRSDGETNAAFAALLSELTPIHIRILDAAGFRAIRAGWKSGLALEKRLFCSIQEIKEIACNEDLAKIESALDYLHALGLMELTLRALGFEQANLTPTRLGLNFYAWCSGETDLCDAIRSADEQSASRLAQIERHVNYGEEQTVNTLHQLSCWNSANSVMPRSEFEAAERRN